MNWSGARAKVRLMNRGLDYGLRIDDGLGIRGGSGGEVAEGNGLGAENGSGLKVGNGLVGHGLGIRWGRGSGK